MKVIFLLSLLQVIIIHYALNNLIYSGFVDLSSNSNTSTTQVKIVNKIDSINFSN